MKRMISSVAATIALTAFPVFADPLSIDQPKCETVAMTVYFPANEAMLSDAASKAIAAEAARVAGCSIAEVTMSALSLDVADTTGAEALSTARTESVMRALSERGIVNAVAANRIAPDPVAVRSANAVTPLARRVDVTIVPVAAMNS